MWIVWSLIGTVCVALVLAAIATAIVLFRNRQKVNALQELVSTLPAGQEPPAPPKVRVNGPTITTTAILTVDPPAERKQTVSRTFDAWDVGKTEEMLVVCLMGEGKEQEAIDLLQLRIKRKKSQSSESVSVIPVTDAV